MAADFWTSTHCKLLVTKSRLRECQPEDRARGLSDGQVCALRAHFCMFISELTRTHAKLRQRVATTAMFYFRRFYLKNSYCNYDPRLVAPGCLYLASKVEETTLAAKHLVTCIKKLRPTWPYDTKHLLEVEMVLLEELDYALVVFSPHQPLVRMLRQPPLVDKHLPQHAWAVLNDMYRTDLCLVHPPYILALGCIYTASIVLNLDISAWLATLNVEMGAIYDVAQELLAMYEQQRSSTLSPEHVTQLLDLLSHPLPPPA